MRLAFTKVHPHVPNPTIGYTVDWAERHLSIPNLGWDERHCPGIFNRESVGITLSFPYTLKMYDDSHVEVTHLLGRDDDRVFIFDPIFGGPPAIIKTDFGGGRKYVEIYLPTNTPETLRLCSAGDLRCHVWVAESGVIIDDPLPEGYQWFITELPNTPSRPDLTVGQCLTSDDRPRHLKIPLVFTPELGGYVEIVAGTPIVQYLPVLIPELELVKDGLRTTKVDNVDEAGVTAARRAAGCPI